jgi:hypothetical protein
MRGYVFVFFLLGLGALSQYPARGRNAPAATSTSEGAPDGGTVQPATGYVITPSGTIIFPNAPPPAGDTSTLSGDGPNVSSGPVVGSGPEVSTGPVVGSGPQVSTGPVVGTSP